MNRKVDQGTHLRIRVKKVNQDVLHPYPILELHGDLVFRIRQLAGVKAITGICTGFTTFIIDGGIAFSGQRGYEWADMKSELLKEGWRVMRDHYIEVDKEWILGMLRESRP